MWNFIVERGVGIASGAFALAAQLSGFTNTAMALALVAVAAFFLIAPICHHAHAWHKRRIQAGLRSVEPSQILAAALVGVAVFALIALGAIVWQWRSPASPPSPEKTPRASSTNETRPSMLSGRPVSGLEVVQRLQQVESELEQTKRELAAAKSPAKPSDFEWGFERHPGYNFIGMSADADKRILVHFFQAQGFNRTKDPIAKIHAYVRSDRTNVQYPIYFNLAGQRATESEINPIPVDAIIDIRAPFLPNNGLMPVQKFLNEVVPFTFFFEYDGKTYRHSFSLSDVEPLIRAYEQEVRKSSVRPPQMSKKDASK